MKNVINFTLMLVMIALISCTDNSPNSDCSIYSYYDNGSKREVSCFKSDTMKYTEFDKNGDTISIYVYKITNEKDTVSLFAKDFQNNKLTTISYSNDNYFTAYNRFLSDSDITYQYNVEDYAYYQKVVSKNNFKKLETYYPKIVLQKDAFAKDTIDFLYSMPIPDSLLHPDLYFKYGLTQFEELPDDSEKLGELFHTIKALDSFKAINHKNRVVKLKVDSLSKYNLLGYIYNAQDSGHHGVTIIDL